MCTKPRALLKKLSCSSTTLSNQKLIKQPIFDNSTNEHVKDILEADQQVALHLHVLTAVPAV